MIQKSKRSQANRQLEMGAESSDNEEVPADVNDGDADDVLPNIDRNSCYRCEQPYDNNLAAWIDCNRCPRLMHRSRVTSIDLSCMPESDLEELCFECDYC